MLRSWPSLVERFFHLIVEPTSNISATEFFAALNQHCEGMLEFRVLPSTHRQFFEDCRSIGPFLTQYANENIYFGVSTRRDDTSGKLENCVDLGALFMDLDFKGQSEEEARKPLESFPLLPSIVIHSGGGLHLYWLLNEPFHLQDQEDCRQAYSYLRRLALHLHGDLAAAEPARILRVPGTTNLSIPHLDRLKSKPLIHRGFMTSLTLRSVCPKNLRPTAMVGIRHFP